MISGFTVVALVALMIYGWATNWGFPVAEEDESEDVEVAVAFSGPGAAEASWMQRQTIQNREMTQDEINEAYWANRGRNENGTFTRQG